MAAADLGWRSIFNRVVIVCALGYFVDIYDLILFAIVREPSLAAIGIPIGQQLDATTTLLNWQMGGMLLGGLFWGILGDKRGRRSILFGSIALYSVANIANAFATSVPQYALWRFLAGIGLAGELGAAVTLVSETLPTRLRGYGTMVVSGVGILGAVAGYFVARMPWELAGLASWQVAFLFGGVLGLVLLLARVAISESAMFKAAEEKAVSRGDLRLIFTSKERSMKLLHSALIGVPTWCIIGILVLLSPEIARDIGVDGAVVGMTAVVWCYVGASTGSFLFGGLSQWLGTRRGVVIGALAFSAAMNLVYAFARGFSPEQFYVVTFLLGIGAGYWAVFVTMGAEQFGTNLRATVATSVPNFVRGSTVLLTLAFREVLAPRFGLALGAVLLLSACILVALNSVRRLRETSKVDLDYYETADPEPSRAPLAARTGRRAPLGVDS